MASIVLVHGSWHTPAHYAELASSLQAKGFSTHCPRLTTSVATLPLPKTASLANDTALIRSTIQSLTDRGQKVIVLMHSYGGVVGTNGLDGLLWPQRQRQGLHGGVVALVYVTGFVQARGTCLNTAFGGGDDVPFLDYDTENDLIYMKDSRQSFYNHVESDEEARKWLNMTTLCPAQGNRDLQEFVPYEFIGRGVDATYLVCTRDYRLTTEIQEGMATLLGEARRMEYCDAGHCPMIGYVETIADVMQRAWEYTKERLEREAR